MGLLSNKQTQETLAPTLWRTCRVLANRPRLRILHNLIWSPDQTVSQLAAALGLSVSMASQYLRALNARSLLTTGRAGKNVYYKPASGTSVGGSGSLLTAIERTFATEKHPIGIIFRQATAFTHPRRVTIVKVLRGNRLSKPELQSRTAISRRALTRHLQKLADRGFVENDGSKWHCTRPDSRLGKTLLDLACKG